MIIYLLNILLVTIFSSLAVRYSKTKYIKSLNEKKKVPDLFFVLLILFCLISVYSLRWYVGTDFSNYYDLYFAYGRMDFSEIIGTRDWGFYLLANIMYKIFPENFLIYNFVLACLTYIPTIMILRKYSKNFTFSILLFITMMVYYSGFNGVRQAIAVSICFTAFPLLYNKKFLLYSLAVLIAYLFHSTALLMLPLMFFVTRKSWSKPIMIILVILLISIFALPSIWGYLITFLDFIGQEKMANDYNYFKETDEGINIIRILVAAIPVILSFFFYKILKLNNSNIDLLINMSLLCLVFLLFGLQMTVLARISSYFFIFNILLIPEIANVFKGKERVVFKVITVGLFFIYMLMLLPVDSNLLPYRFIINK